MTNIDLRHGDCLDILAELPDASVDAVVTDPPYGLANTTPQQVADTIIRWVNGERDYLPGGAGFMGKAWDAFVPPVAVWDECLRVLKPGGHVLAFAGSRTHDLMTLGLRLAGFDIRDSVAWLYGSGFPKSLDVSKAIDKAAGAEREVVGSKETRDLGRHGRIKGDMLVGTYEGGVTLDITAPATDAARTWQGWGTALKPAFEPVVVARKPLEGTVASNVLSHGTGALNIDATRIGMSDADREKFIRGDAAWREMNERRAKGRKDNEVYGEYGIANSEPHTAGRWPANVVLDESQAAALDEQSGECPGNKGITGTHGGGRSGGVMGEKKDREYDFAGYGDTGGASRFFYIARRETTCATGALSASNVESGMARSAEPAATSWEPDDGDCCDDCEWEREHDYGLTLPLDQLGARFRYVAKADASERVRVNGTAHPTVKPLALMRWLVRLVTPPGGTVLEPFAGSGTTVEACILEGFDCIAIEREADYLPLIRQRINRRRDPVEAVRATGDDGGLFDLLDEEPA